MNNKSGWNDFYSKFRYVPNREIKSREYSGAIDFEDFFTGSPTGHTVIKIVEAMAFNKSLEKEDRKRRLRNARVCL